MSAARKCRFQPGCFVNCVLRYPNSFLSRRSGSLRNTSKRTGKKPQYRAFIPVLSACALTFTLLTGCLNTDDRQPVATEPAASELVTTEPLATPPTDSPYITELPEVSETCEVSAEIEAKYAYLLELDTNTVLYAKESETQTAPASTAKMLTALTVLEYCGEDDSVTLGEEIQLIAEDASRAWLSVGSELTVRQLLVALLLPSGNDAAYALAVYTGRILVGSDAASAEEAIAAFVEAMNTKAAEIGAVDSHFLVPDGYDTEGQYTTARDLALIAAEFLNYDTLREIAGSYRISNVWLSGEDVTYYNTNELLNPDSPYYYEQATGLKTGRSVEAGSCLISCASIDGRQYICVVMGSTDEARWSDSIALFDAVAGR